VAKEATKVVVCELHQGIIVHEARAQMYMDDAAAEEERVATGAEVTAAWVLFDGNEMKVEDNEDEAEAERDTLLRAVEVAIRVAAAQRDAELAACAAVERQQRHQVEDLAEGHVKVEAELAAVERVAAMEAAHITKVEVVKRDTVERATHWADEIDKALAYQRDVDRREAGQTLRCQDAAIRAVMAAIDGTGPVGNGDGAAQL
jgi:ribosomal protein L19